MSEIEEILEGIASREEERIALYEENRRAYEQLAKHIDNDELKKVMTPGQLKSSFTLGDFIITVDDSYRSCPTLRYSVTRNITLPATLTLEDKTASV